MCGGRGHWCKFCIHKVRLCCPREWKRKDGEEEPALFLLQDKTKMLGTGASNFSAGKFCVGENRQQHVCARAKRGWGPFALQSRMGRQFSLALGHGMRLICYVTKGGTVVSYRWTYFMKKWEVTKVLREDVCRTPAKGEQTAGVACSLLPKVLKNMDIWGVLFSQQQGTDSTDHCWALCCH